jgi:hypothetical protein
VALFYQRLGSTAIAEWEYNDERFLLYVLFTDATLYRFRVDLRTWGLLQSAASKGRAFNRLVLRNQKGLRLR